MILPSGLRVALSPGIDASKHQAASPLRHAWQLARTTRDGCDEVRPLHLDETDAAALTDALIDVEAFLGGFAMDKRDWIEAFIAATHQFVDDHESAVRSLGEQLWPAYGEIDPSTVARGNIEARSVALGSGAVPSS